MIWKKCLWLLILFPCIKGYAQEPIYSLIPRAYQEKKTEGYFKVSGNFTSDYNGTDSFLGLSFSQWIKTDVASVALKGKTIQTRISLQYTGKARWRKQLGKLLLDASFDPGTEGYVIKIEQNSMLVLAQTDTGMFYGFQTLKQLMRMPAIPCGVIYDRPRITLRAWQDDISRGPIPTMAQLKKEIEVLSSFKLNTFTLYTENVFKYSSYPGAAPADGISADEINELRVFAARYYVKLIANQQSFGHMEKLLKQPGFEQLGEAGHILSPAFEQTYSMLGNFYKEQLNAYKSKYFILNADETEGLGSGASKALADSLGSARLYALHIQRICKLLPADVMPAIWADIVLQHPEMIPLLPRNLVLIPWAYGNEKSFTSYLKPVAASGFNFWVAPSVGNYNNLFPNQLSAAQNIFSLIRDGYALGAKGVLNTSWDDDGYNLFVHNYKGFAWGACLSWQPPVASDENWQGRWQPFEKAWDIHYWGAPVSAVEDSLAILHENKLAKVLANSVFFENIFPTFPDQLSLPYIQQCKESELKLMALYKLADSLLMHSGPNALNAEQLKLSIREALFADRKKILRYNYQQMLSGLYQPVKLKDDIEQLQKQLINLSNDFSMMYLDENRPFFLDNNLQRIEKLQSQLSNIPNRVNIVAEERAVKKGRKFSLQAPLYAGTLKYNTGKGWKTYQKPFYVKENISLQAAGVAPSGNLLTISADSFLYHKALGSVSKINIPWSKYHLSYSGGGIQALTDGRTGDARYLTSGRWQGFSGSDLIIDLQLDALQTLQTFEMGFYQNFVFWVLLPAQVEILVSTDGIQYSSCGTITHHIPVQQTGALKHVFRKDLMGVKATHVRIIAKYYGPLPQGHLSAGSPSMLFADEIIIR